MNKAEKISLFVYYNNFLQYFEKHKIKTRVYVDSRDIITMLHGLKGMISPTKSLDEKIYKDDSTLIYSLIYGGWLNQVYLTTPHQEELYNHINNSFSFSVTDEDDIQEFWDYVHQMTNLSQEDFEKKITTKEYLEKIKAKSNDLYIANYLLRETDWRKRLNYMRKASRLEFETNSDNFLEIVKSELFTKIHASFKVIRPAGLSSKNNLTDSFVLCVIQIRLQLYKQNKIQFIPILYDAKKLFQKVIKHAEIENEFYCIFEGANFNVICDSEFLIYSALFNKKDKIKFPTEDSEIEKYSSYREFSEILFSHQNKIGEDFVKQYEKEIEDFRHSRFLQICWINNNEDVHEFIEELINLKKQILRSEESRDLVKKSLNSIMAELKEKVEKYSIFKDTYQKIDSSYHIITNLFTSNLTKYENRDHDFDVINDMSLTRFSINPVYCKKVRDISKELLFSNEDESKNHLIVYLVENIIKGLEGRKDNSIIISLTILWILGEYRLIKKILEKFNGYYNHYSEAFLHAAVIAKAYSENRFENKKLLNILAKVNNYSSETEFSNNYKTSIAASYIYFQLWIKKSNKNFRILFLEPVETENDEINLYFKRAVKLARIAILWLQDRTVSRNAKTYRKSKYYYVLNNYIYYITLGGTNIEFLKLNKEIDLLIGLEFDHPEYWQFRYHDTLAVYYLRKALLEKDFDQQKFQNYKKAALERVNEALEWVIGVEDQRTYKQLKNKIETL